MKSQTLKKKSHPHPHMEFPEEWTLPPSSVLLPEIIYKTDV